MAPQANGWGMNTHLTNWLQQISKGLPGDNLPVVTKPVRLYSCRNIPIGGAATRNFSFFDQNKGRGVQSIPPNGIPSNQALALTAIRFGIQYGFDVQGRRLGQDAPTAAQKLLSSLSAGSFNAAASDLLAAQWKAAETIREFMDQGFVSFTVQDELIFEVKGLTSLPDGKGSLVQAGLSQTSTSATVGQTSDIVQSLSNGAPVIGNAWKFSAPWPLPSNQQFKIEVNHQKIVDFADATLGPLAGEADTVIAATLTCELEGILGVSN